MKKLESDVQSSVTEWARERGIECSKLNTDNGYPDYIFWLPLRPALIEFKRPDEKPSPLQLHRIGILLELGYDVTVADTKEKAIRFLKTCVQERFKTGADNAIAEFYEKSKTAKAAQVPKKRR